MDFFSIFQSIWTVVVFVIFIGIILWAWSGKNKDAFDEAAHIPFDDVKSPSGNKKETITEENVNG